jgi:hypothetical protein
MLTNVVGNMGDPVMTLVELGLLAGFSSSACAAILLCVRNHKRLASLRTDAEANVSNT